MKTRVRFAPSPTGNLHIGGARTALFNWLYARRVGGTLVLRIEDTDRSRNTEEAMKAILHGLRWLGLDWDEGPDADDPAARSKGDRGPYFQSRRQERYAECVERLIQSGRAYRQDGAVRFRMPREPVVVQDLIVGEVVRHLTDREEKDPDFVIVRSDGNPVFHLVNVVDDLDMEITHVIRGEDHLSNTSRHIELFKALEAPPPRYAHIPLILNEDGSKMSKRDLGSSIQFYMEEGFAPEAVVNYLALLGWSPKEDREIMTLDEMVQRFDLPQVLRHNARFDYEKLQWMNYEYLRAMAPARYRQLAAPFLSSHGVQLANYPEDYIHAALGSCQEKVKKLSELPAFCGFYFQSEFPMDEESAEKHLTADSLPRMKALRDSFQELESFDADSIQACLKACAERLGVKPKALVHPIRLACTGKPVGPSLYHLMEILGKEETIARVDRAVAAIGGR